MSKIALIIVEKYQGPWEVGQTFQPYSIMLDHNGSNNLKWTNILGYHLLPIPSCTCLYFWKTESPDWLKLILIQDGLCSFPLSSFFVQPGSTLKPSCFYIEGFDLIFYLWGTSLPNSQPSFPFFVKHGIISETQLFMVSYCWNL